MTAAADGKQSAARELAITRIFNAPRSLVLPSSTAWSQCR
jgi:hypothetical protein